uniref:Reverse transcriptase domain-containing protein n=1 Tax=Astyanax mexicanus TaxID=7994 RepID=A0A3B1JFC8_ASTMX
MVSPNSHLKIVTWNVRGLNSVLKRSKVFSHLNSLHADIMFLQETHIKHSDAHKLRCKWIGQMYHSTFLTKARGVSILIRKNIPFEHLLTKKDPNGRYLIVTGTILSRHVTFLNLYAPNFDDPSFFRSVFKLIPDMATTHLVIGGDFNCVLDPFMDKQSPPAGSPSNSTTVLNKLIQSLNIVDIWRLQNPTGKDFSFFSNVHKTHSRIDYFLIDSKLATLASSSDYHSILISDHCPVSVSIDFGVEKAKYSWRFNPNLLHEKGFQEYCSARIVEYLDFNDTGETSDSTLWEAFKAVMRGHILSYEAELKKQKRKRLSEIELQFSTLEQEFRKSASQSTLASIMKLKYEYNNILSSQIKTLLLKVKQKHFELGNKPSCLLSYQLRGLQKSRAILKIKNRSGYLTTKLSEINKCFKEYYQELYTSKSTTDTSVITNFLKSLNLPKLDTVAREKLNAEITLNEVSTAINVSLNGKAPGPDGFSTEFYKAFCKQISPLLLRMFQDSIKNNKLPETLYLANISLFLKKDKEEVDPSSYRPISLLGSDLKVFTKILAGRLNECISSIIHQDQTGFISGRFSFFNVRRLLNIVYKKHEKHDRVAILALDANKAFDQVEWKYILAVIEEFGLGQTFTSWVEMLYLCPKASILTNNDSSPSFFLFRGTRQGCPLSPLLFALAMEPLALAIKSHPLITPVRLGGIEHQISLYADDVLLYLCDPEQSIPPLLKLIKDFGHLSGYTVNWAKSQYMPLYDSANLNFLNVLPFKVTDKIKYLGITVPRDFKMIYDLNYKIIFDNLKSNTETWRVLPLSLMGRINAIKMVILPRFLYLFQNLPIFLPKSFFKNLDSMIMPFIWGYKFHRISKKHLCKPRDIGGLALPCFQYYYWAANARVLTYWTNAYPDESHVCTPAWLVIEQNITAASLPSLLFAGRKPFGPIMKENPIVGNSLKIWYQIKKALALPETCIMAPIAYNHAFLPSLTDKVFQTWKARGIINLEKLYVDGIFASFSQLKLKFDLPASHFFRYLQLRSYVKANIECFEKYSHQNIFYSLLTIDPDSRGLVSRFVDHFQKMGIPSTQSLKEQWEEELGMEILDDFWAKSLQSIQSCSINTSYQLIQYKVLHRLHYSQTKLHSIYADVSPLCAKCKSQNGTLAHLFWSCPNLQNFWLQVFYCYATAYKISLSPDPLVAILGWSSAIEQHDDYCTIQAIQHGMVIAKKTILLVWNKETAPKYETWLSELLSTLHMEKIRYEREGKFAKFGKIWNPLLTYIDDQLDQTSNA